MADPKDFFMSGRLFQAQANIAKNTVGQIKEVTRVGTTITALPGNTITFSALNIGADVVANDVVMGGVTADGLAFFSSGKQSGGGIPPCDCVEKDATQDSFNQLSNYCNITNLNQVLPFSKDLTFEIISGNSLTDMHPPRFKIEYASDPAFTTIIGTSNEFNFSGFPQAVPMATGITGTQQQVLPGTIDTISLELVENSDAQNQVSGLGGVLKLPGAMEGFGNGQFEGHIIDDTGGFFHFEFYDPGAFTLLFHTASYNTTGVKPIIDDVAFGFSGTITIDNIGTANTAIRYSLVESGDPLNQISGYNIDDIFTSTREKVYIRVVAVNNFFVNIYSGGCLIGHTVPGTATGAVAVVPDTPPGSSWPCPALGGTITVDRWFSDDFSILVNCPSGTCCGTNNCSGDNAPGQCCTVVTWTRSDTSTSGQFSMGGFCQFSDPGCCADGSQIGAWKPFSGGVANGLDNYGLDGDANRTSPCDPTITWQFNDPTGFAVNVAIWGPGYSGTFVIGTVTYNVSTGPGVGATNGCLGDEAAFPY